MLLQLDFPPGFEVVDASPISLFGNNTWLLGSLEPLEEKKITVTGVMYGEEGQAKTIRAYVGNGNVQQGGITTVFNSLSTTVDLVKPFLLAELFVDRSTEETISLSAGRKISGSIVWRNTLSEAIKSPEIILSMGGSAYDRTGVSPQSGFFNSSENKIIWSKETLESLRVVEPGETGTVRFTLTPDTGRRFTSSLPQVSLQVGVKGVDSSGQLREASQTDTMQVQIGTVLDVLAESLHYTGPFNNLGAMPPKVGRSTDYTVRWTVTNSSSPVDRARATATLPPYVEWKGQTSPAGENIRYEPNSRTVVWDLGELSAGSGFGGGRSAYFQVSIVPSLSQVGETVDLTSRISITGVDSFTGASVSGQTRAPTTRLLNDGNSTRGASGRIEE